jgi:glycosyltransferase involved in cell wall biosynthesis
MEIIVVDDASTDNIAEVVAEAGKGRIQFFRHPQNVGHTRNFFKGLELSRGHLVHILHGDDAVLWGYYKTIGDLFGRYPGIGAAYCRFHFMDGKSNINYTSPLEMETAGILPDFLEKISRQCILQTPSISVRRQVYETIGTFDSRLKYTEDWEMWQRIAVHYPVAYTPKVLALYRNNHSNNNTLKTTRSGGSIKDLLQVYHLLRENAAGKIEGLEEAHQRNLVFLVQHQIQQLYSDGYRKIAIDYVKQIQQLKLGYKLKRDIYKVFVKMEVKYRLR